MRSLRTINILVSLAVIFSGMLQAQFQKNIPKYSFLKEELNHLNFSSDSSAFMGLFKKMDDLREKTDRTIHVVHIGGSHVQGGIWSNTFICDLQGAFKTAGGGYFTFPYKIAKTNSQPYATSFSNGSWKRCRAVVKDLCLPLGMSGLSVITNDSANIFTVSLTGKAACKYVNIVKMYHNFNPSFEVNISDANLKISREDHQKEGFTLFKFDMPVDSVAFTLQRKDTLQRDFILYGFSFENDLTAGFYLAGLGVNGASSDSYLRCSEFRSQLPTIKGDLFILSLGVNDSQSTGFDKSSYMANYDTLITIIREASPGAAILLTTTTDNFIRRKTANKRTKLTREVMLELMDRQHVAVWDLYTVMGGYRSMLKWGASGLASRDRVHFTAKGYVILGDLMFNAFMKSYTNNSSKK